MTRTPPHYSASACSTSSPPADSPLAVGWTRWRPGETAIHARGWLGGQRVQKGRVARMNGSSTQTEPAKRSRRRAAAVFAMLFLVIGVGLLWYSFVARQELAGNASAAPSPTTSLSPMAQTRTPAPSMAPTPSPGATLQPPPPPTVVVTTYVPVPTYVNAPASASEDSDLLPLVTTVSGLLASLAGIVSAIVSVRGPRSR
jgi:hypothetical protein